MTNQNYAAIPTELQQKMELCRQHLRNLGGVVVAFSAGVDSTFLLAMALETLGMEHVVAGMGVSPSLPDRELRSGRALARDLGAELVEVPTGELNDANYAANPTERCFYCKNELFKQLLAMAEQRGLAAVVCGANADDRGDFRPGLQAGEQCGIINPLMEAGMTKDDIRAASRAMGLETWDKPAMACLASRVPYGQEITAEKLSRIERAEYCLKDMGFIQCRVRDHGSMARIEVPAEDIPRAISNRPAIVASLKGLGYTYVCLDLQGFRSGSLNEVIATDDRTAGQ